MRAQSGNIMMIDSARFKAISESQYKWRGNAANLQGVQCANAIKRTRRIK